MKRTIYVVIFFLSAIEGFSQANKSEILANQFAETMMDSIRLTKQQTHQILKINIHLSDQKELIRFQTQNVDSLQVRIQKVESMRDSLYKKILDSNQYLIYKEKKRFLIGAR